MSAPLVAGRSSARFWISGLATAALTFGLAWVTAPPTPTQPTSLEPNAARGAPAGFLTVRDPDHSPSPLGPPPAEPTEARAAGDPGPIKAGEASDETGYRALEGVGNIEVFLGVCVRTPPPAFCPAGVPAVYPSPKSAPPTVPPLVDTAPLDLLYADTPQPGIQRTIFSAPPGIDPSFSYWPSDGSGQALLADVKAATLDGHPVWIATFPVQPGAYDFVASASQGGVVKTSEVGSIQIGPSPSPTSTPEGLD